LDKNKAMNNVQKYNICTNVPSSQTSDLKIMELGYFASLTCIAMPTPGTKALIVFGDGRTEADGEAPLLEGVMFCPSCTELPQCLVGMVLTSDTSNEDI
jgi:hypothetical protein